MALGYISVLDANGVAREVLADIIDEESNRYAQVLKAAFGAETDATLVSASDPMPAALYDQAGNRRDFAMPGEVVVNPTIDTAAAYSNGDNLVGTIITLADLATTTGGTGWVTHMWVQDQEGILGGTKPNFSLEVVILNASLTPNAANAAYSLSDADAQKIRQVIRTSDAEVIHGYGGGTWLSVAAGQAKPYKLASGVDGYAVIKVVDTSSDAPQWTSATALRFGFHFAAD